MPEKKLSYPVTSRGKGDVATVLLGLFDAYQQMENDRLIAEGRASGAPRSMEEITKMLAFDRPFSDIRYATGPLQGEQYWSPDPGLNYVPDDIELRPISPTVSLDPESGMLYATPPFAPEGQSGVNYADYAVRKGLAKPSFRGDIAIPVDPAWRPPPPPAPSKPAPIDTLTRWLGLEPLTIQAEDGSR